MNEKSIQHLSHLTNKTVENIKTTWFDSYVIALEGWRRGLTLKWYLNDTEGLLGDKYKYLEKPGYFFSLSSSKKTYYFLGNYSNKNSKGILATLQDRNVTRELLNKHRINIPEGENFSKDVPEEKILEYATKIGFPLVLKPRFNQSEKEVILAIRDEDELKSSLDHFRNEQDSVDIILERHIFGEYYSVYILENEIIGAIKRLPANIVGNGYSSIEELIKLKNECRSRTPILAENPLIINDEIIDFLYTKGHTLDSVPKVDETVYLINKIDTSLGGEVIDVVENLPTLVKKKAESTFNSIQGLNYGSIDIVVDNQTDEVYTTNLNLAPVLKNFVFPTQGAAVDIPKKIIDYHFPETKKESSDISKLYFDLNEVLDPLQERTAYSTTVTPVKDGPLYGKRYIINGNVLRYSFHRWLKLKANQKGLYGYVQRIEENKLELVVIGNTKEKVDDFKSIIFEKKEELDITIEVEEEAETTTKIGFTIYNEKKRLRNRYRKLSRKLKKVEKTQKILDKKLSDMNNSRAWQLTAPLMRISGRIKGRFSTKR